MTARPPRPPVAELAIRRLTLPPGQPTAGLGEAVAAALTRELGGGTARRGEGTIAEAIAQGIALHPVLASTVSGDGGKGR
jgi:hypothetical protein